MEKVPAIPSLAARRIHSSENEKEEEKDVKATIQKNGDSEVVGEKEKFTMSTSEMAVLASRCFENEEKCTWQKSGQSAWSDRR